MICKRCVLPHCPPHITIDEQGICNLCREFDQEQGLGIADADGTMLETDFVKILNKHRGRQKYDCLCMLSGGKDSTSSVYYIKQKYRLNPLVFTFDHYFETTEALHNIHQAIEQLEVDFLYFKSAFMKRMFEKILKTKSKAIICHLCSIWYMQLSYDVAARYEIPIIIAGWTKGQTTGPQRNMMSKCACNHSAKEYIAMSEATKKFIEEHVQSDPEYKNFPKSMTEVMEAARKRHKCTVLSPHWFLPADPTEYTEMIKKELGWQAPKQSYPTGSTNCALNFVAVQTSMKYYGYTHYHIEMSKMIRLGLMSREEALKALELNFGAETLEPILAKINCQMEDL